MKLLHVYAQNFGSYKELELDLANIGLGLISGPTGSGKSTISDMICWALFGQTAKGGNVDEVRSWQVPDEVTKVILELELSKDNTLLIIRARGGSNENDLYWIDESSTIRRGKDLRETQAFINELLGMDDNLYLTSAYFSEFSPTTSFFVAKTKDQRDIFENLVNLDLPVSIAEKSTEKRKNLKTLLVDFKTKHDRLEGKILALHDSISNLDLEIEKWEIINKEIIEDYTDKADNFEEIKQQQIEQLYCELKSYETSSTEWLQIKIKETQTLLKEAKKARCKECNAPSNQVEVEDLRDNLQHLTNELYKSQQSLKRKEELLIEIENIRNSTNNYLELLETEMRKNNPMKDIKINTLSTLEKLEQEQDTYNQHILEFNLKISALQILYDLSFALRAELLKKVISEVEASTNRYLKTYFDSELKVGFSMEDSDSLKVSIQKNGYDCVYKQLSKGQRGLLKLCFTVSVMKASANKIGTHFDNLFFDEALEGFSPELKIKAYSLFEELSKNHSSILVVEHSSEFQELFATKYKVSLVGDCSHVQIIRG